MRRYVFFILFISTFIVSISPTSHCHSLSQGNISLPDIGVDEKLGAQLPLNLTLTDQNGRRVKLGDYMGAGPIVLTLNYYSCPTLCPLVLKNLGNTVSTIKGLSIGRDYSIVTISIDPDETLERTRAKAEETRLMMDRTDLTPERWPFLFGEKKSIDSLANTVGFRYEKVGDHNFAHPSVFIVLTPAGKVARYLYGIDIRPGDLKLALMEAAGGKIGGSPFLNQVLLYCYHYDPVGKKYSLAAVNIMKITGIAIVALMGVLILTLWRSDKGNPLGAGKKTGAANR
jgi:protein SCO1/2